MTKRELNLAIFKREPVDGVLFQPRLEPWYDWHKQFGSLPESYRNRTLLQFLDDMDVSMRYIHYYTGMPDPVERKWPREAKVREERRSNRILRVIETPMGELHEELQYTIDHTWRTVVFPVKNREDVRKLTWLMARVKFHYDPAVFGHGADFVGDRGEPSFWVPKSPYQALAQIWMKYEDFIEALADFPAEIEEAMRAIDEAYDPLYRGMCEHEGLNIVNFGENLHGELLTPRYIERYLMPFYAKRAGQLREAGKYTHMHLDGHVRPLLKYLQSFPFDGIEALTPKPQGDVTLEEIRYYLGDKILLDGIPAALFLPHHHADELEECLETIVERFFPRLVLGISDELPQGSGPEALDRVRWVARYCRARAVN